MAMAGNIISAVLVCSMVSTFVLAQDSDAISATTNTNEKYRGEWYQIGLIWNRKFTPSSCLKHNVELGDGDSVIIGFSSKDRNNKFIEDIIPGEISSSELLLGSRYSLTDYNNGNQLLVCSKSGVYMCGILSRQSTVPQELLEPFEELARTKNMLVSYVNQNNCAKTGN